MIDFFRAPLVQFLAIGALIYVVTGWWGTSQEGGSSERTITVTAGEIAALEQSWLKRWIRPPTQQERDGIIRDYVRETVLYREALAMGLDDNDTIIRRRLGQKLEFLVGDLIAPREPTAAEISAFFAEHAEDYRVPDTLTLSQVFFDPDLRDVAALDDADAARDALNASADPTEVPEEVGDAFMLQRYYPERTQAELAKLFGQEFSANVMGLETGTWHGPLLSGYGVHLVYVHDRTTNPLPELAVVEAQVRADWSEAQRQRLNQQYFGGLMSRYEVVIEESPAQGLVVAEAP